MAKKKTKAPKPVDLDAAPEQPALELAPYVISLEIYADAAFYSTAQMLAADVARVANEAAMEFCDHVLRVRAVLTEIEGPEDLA